MASILNMDPSKFLSRLKSLRLEMMLCRHLLVINELKHWDIIASQASHAKLMIVQVREQQTKLKTFEVRV